MRAFGWLALAAAGLGLGACGEEGGADPPDTLPPAILRSEPADGATGVSPEVVVRVWLDEPFDNSLISGDQLYLRRGTTLLYGSLSRDLAQAMLALDLAVPLEAGVTYEAVLSPGVCDQAPVRNCTRAPLSFSFQVAP